jgi:hypothetical protein
MRLCALWRGLRPAVGALVSISLCGAGADAPPPRPPPLPTTFPFGLSEGASAQHYTTALDLGQPLLAQRGGAAFMAAARADARERLGLGAAAALSAEQAGALEASVRAHLAAACTRCDAFLSSGAVPGREEMRAALMAMLGQRGQLALLLGGKGVGKSLLLAELARRTDMVGAGGATRVVLCVDARQFSTDLCAGLQAALLGGGRELEGSAWWGWLGGHAPPALGQRRAQGSGPGGADASPTSHAASASLSATLRGIAVKAKLALAAAPLTPSQRSAEMLSQVVELAEAQGLYICLVVDEATLAFPTPPSQPPAGAAAPAPLSSERQRLLHDTRLLLQRLVLLTKQSRRMSALLVTSEHAFPYHLRHEGFFNTANLTGTLFAGEVPPERMQSLLREAWGLGPRLSDVFLAFYGGHVHMASEALPRLAGSLDLFDCEEVAPDGAAGAIARCLEADDAAGTMRGMLRAMALQGFAPVGHEGNACAQALSRASLGGLVKTSATVVGLPHELRAGESYGVVPASHFMVRAAVRRAGAFPPFVFSAPFPNAHPPPSRTLPHNRHCHCNIAREQRHLIARALSKAKA